MIRSSVLRLAFTATMALADSATWNATPISSYDAKYCPSQSSLDFSTAVPLPVYLSHENNVFTFRTANYDQQIDFKCVSGSGSLTYSGFGDKCTFQLNAPITCDKFVAVVTPGPKTGTKRGQASNPYSVSSNSGMMKASVVSLSATAGPVDISFNAVDYGVPSATEVLAIVFFTARPSGSGDVLQGGQPLVNPSFTAVATSADQLTIGADATKGVDGFQVPVTLSCTSTPAPQQITIDAAACKAAGNQCGPVTTRSLVFIPDPSGFCTFTSTFSPDMSLYVLPPKDTNQVDASTHTYYYVPSKDDSVLLELYSKFYLTSTRYGFTVTGVSVNGHALTRDCLSLETMGDYTGNGVMGVKMALRGGSTKYQGCKDAGELAFVDGSKNYTVKLSFDAAMGIPDFDALDTTNLGDWYGLVSGESLRRDGGSTLTVSAKLIVRSSALMGQVSIVTFMIFLAFL
ncbi:hypothetical protein BC830DRAFT_1158070 [Chytriomyces sp. MP71]|nr:hypothetical protein BC830DRAFT_1158070 [Chytriomyces sp. MP71]